MLKKERVLLKKFDKVFNPSQDAVYVLLNGSAPLHKGKRKLYKLKDCWEHIDNGYNIGYLPSREFCVIDIDDREQSNMVIKIVKFTGLRTWIIKTNRGIHLYFKRPPMFDKNSVKGRNVLDIPEYDYLVNNSIVLPFGSHKKVIKRKVMMSTDNVPDIPLWLHPLRLGKKADVFVEFPVHRAGNRNQNLFKLACRLIEKRFNIDDIKEVATIVAKVVFYDEMEPYTEAELNDTLYSIEKYKPSTFQDDIDLFNFHTVNAHGEPIGVLHDSVVDYVIDTKDLASIGSSIYLYERGAYEYAPEKVKHIIKQLMIKKFRTYNRIKEIYNLLVSDIRIQKTWDQFNKHLDHINFKNGMYNVTTGELEQHNPQYLSTAQIPHEYHKAKSAFEDTQYYDFMVNQCHLSKADVRMIMQYHLYAMTVRNNLKAFLMVVGPSNTGKSTLIGLIERTIGYSNISNVGIQELSMRFYASALFGKLLNSKADDRSEALSNISNLKMITGQDQILHEKKGQDAFFFKAMAKLIFSFNQPPLQLEEKSDAFYSRIRFLSLAKKIVLNQEYVDKLYDEIEEYIPHLVKHRDVLFKSTIQSSKKSDKLVEDLRMSSDSVEAFVKDCVSFTPNDKVKLPKSEVFLSYANYCIDKDRKGHGKQMFYKYMDEKGYHSARRHLGGVKTHCFIGVKLRELEAE